MEHGKVLTEVLTGWQAEAGGLEEFKERRVMDRRMKARERMKYQEVSALDSSEDAARRSLINL